MPLRETKTEYGPTGAVVKVYPALGVQFAHAAGVPDWAKDAVQRLPNWGNGLGHDEDPFTRVGILDTDEEAKRQNWTAEEKAYIEEKLLNSTSNGVEFVVCSAPKTPRPWDSYDEFTGEDAVEKIMYTIDLIGADPKGVLRYEKENFNRENVKDAVEGLIEKEEENVVGVISV